LISEFGLRSLEAFACAPAGMWKEKAILDDLFPEGPSKFLKLTYADLEIYSKYQKKGGDTEKNLEADRCPIF
jgi:hypothetical protein